MLMNHFKIDTFFRHKDRLPKACHSGVIYKYSCAACQASYVGSAYQRLFSRVAQHQGKSHRTGQMLASPAASSIREHTLACGVPFGIDNFEILCKNNVYPDLRILESLHILRLQPTINDSCSSYPLNMTA